MHGNDKILGKHKFAREAGARGGCTPFNDPYGKAPPEKDNFLRLEVYERVGVSLIEVYDKVGRSVIVVCERTKEG